MITFRHNTLMVENIITISADSAEDARKIGVNTIEKLDKDLNSFTLSIEGETPYYGEFAVGMAQTVTVYGPKKRDITIFVGTEEIANTMNATANAVQAARLWTVMPRNKATPFAMEQEICEIAESCDLMDYKGYSISDKTKDDNSMKTDELAAVIKIIEEFAPIAEYEKVMETYTFTNIIGINAMYKPAISVVHYKGNPESDEVDYAFALKGCTFDSGGAQIKDSINIKNMKKDMGAAGIGIGLLHWLSTTKPKLNIVLSFSMAENPIGPEIMYPSDVLSFHGKDIEIGHTDAEGRLLIADAISAMNKEFGINKVNNLVAIGTLTALGRITFGGRRIPIWCGTSEYNKPLEKAGKRSGDKVISMPLDEAYYEAIITGDVADYTSCSDGAGAASGVAAAFIHEMAKLVLNFDTYTLIDCSSAVLGADGALNYAGERFKTKDSTGICVNLLIHLLNDAQGS